MFNGKESSLNEEEICRCEKMAVVQPSLDYIEYEFVGKVQLWRGILVSLDPDAECSFDGRSRPMSAEHSGGSGLKKSGDNDHESKSPAELFRSRHGLSWCQSLFEGLGSGKGKRQKGPSTLP